MGKEKCSCGCDHEHDHQHDEQCNCGCEEHSVASDLMRKGMDSQMQGNFDQAIKNYEATIQELAKTEGQDGPDIGYCKHYIASCLSSLGKIEEAIAMYNEALQLHNKNFGEKSSSSGRVYSELGLLNYHMKKYSESLKLEDKALYIFNNDVEANAFEKALNSVICADIKGATYRTVGLLADAIDCYKAAMQHLTEAQYTVDDAFANYYVSIGQCYLDLEQYQDAESYFQKAVDLYKKDEKTYAAALANALVFKAATLVHQEKYDDMVKVFDDAFKVVETNMEKDCEIYKSLAVTAGDMCAFAEMIEKAYEYYKLAVRTELKDDADEQLKALYPYVYNNLAQCAAHLGKMGEAMEYKEKSMK